jgi:hypothetical protein
MAVEKFHRPYLLTVHYTKSAIIEPLRVSMEASARGILTPMLTLA